MTAEYAIISILVAVMMFFAGFAVSQTRVSGKLSVEIGKHEVIISGMKEAFDDERVRVDARIGDIIILVKEQIGQNGKLIEQNMKIIQNCSGPA
jgi:hypothetical protein